MIVSSVASGDVGPYVGPADITMMYSVTDVQGLNSISRTVLGNGANALVGMVKARLDERTARRRDAGPSLPAIGITMFGVTTPAVQKIAADLGTEFECLVFHATGVGGRSMEKLVDSGQLAAVIDLTTTEVCDLLMGGVFPASDDRFGAVIRGRVPYVGSVGALDMVNFGAPDTVPERYRQRKLHVHNPQVTLMRTTPEENERMGKWIGERLNQMDGTGTFLPPRRRRLRARRARPAVLGRRRRRSSVSRAGADRAPDRQPPAHSYQEAHQRPRVRRRDCQRFPSPARARCRTAKSGEVTHGPV